MLSERLAVPTEAMEPAYIFVFATVIITANAVPYDETHVQTGVGRPYHPVYRGVHIQKNGQQLNGETTTGEQCVAVCEQDTECGSVDYNWLVGYCRRFRNGFSDKSVQRESYFASIHVEVRPSGVVGGDAADYIPVDATIAGWSCLILPGIAYGYPYVQDHGRKIAVQNGVPTGTACVLRCQGTRGCRAVNYRWMDGKCIMLNSGKLQDEEDGITGDYGFRADYIHIEQSDSPPPQMVHGQYTGLQMGQGRPAGLGTGQQMAHGMGSGLQLGQGSGTGRSMNHGLTPQTGRGSSTSSGGYARHRSSGGSK